MKWAFDNYKTLRPAPPAIEMPRLWKGKTKSILLGTGGPVVSAAPQALRDGAAATSDATRASQGKRLGNMADNLAVTVPVRRGANLHWDLTINEPVVAPIAAGSLAGEAALYDGEGLIRVFPVIALENGDEGNFFKKAIHSVMLFFKKKKG
jgi:D-alanyl-D-alanine carboxypeptidase (penicillin-binding protein 5/6)